MVIKSQLGLPSMKSQLGVSGGGVVNEGEWRKRRGGMQRERCKGGTRRRNVAHFLHCRHRVMNYEASASRAAAN